MRRTNPIPSFRLPYPLPPTPYSLQELINLPRRLLPFRGGVYDLGSATLVVSFGADFLETWGEFTLEIPSGPTGEAQLFVGEFSPEDGTPIGVNLDVTMR